MSEDEQLQYAIDLSRTETDNRIKFLDGQFDDELEEGDQENTNNNTKPVSQPSWFKPFTSINKCFNRNKGLLSNYYDTYHTYRSVCSKPFVNK